MNLKYAPLIALAIVTAGCGSTTATTASAGGSTSAQASAAAVASASAPAAPPSCTDQFTAWQDSGGASDSTAVQNDLTALGSATSDLSSDLSTGAPPSVDEAGVQQAAASLEADVQTVQTNLPPSCVPGLRGNLSAAMTDYSKLALDCEAAVTETTSGNSAVSNSDLQAGGRVASAGAAKMDKATAALNSFSNG